MIFMKILDYTGEFLVKLDEVHEVKRRPEFQEFLREGGNIRPQDFQSALLAAGIPSVNLYQ